MAHPQLGIAAASCLLRVVITHLRPVHPVLSWEARSAVSYRENEHSGVSARVPTHHLYTQPLPPPTEPPKNANLAAGEATWAAGSAVGVG